MSTLTGIAGRIPRSGTSHLRAINITLIVLLAAVCGLAYVATQSTAKPAQAAVRTTAATRGVVLSSVSASGTVQSPSDLSVGFQTSGTVTEIDVQQGDQVTEGEVVASLDSTSAEAGVAQAKASLISAEANLSQTKAGETTAQKKADAVAVAQGHASLTQAKTQLANALTQLTADKKTAAASLATAQSLTTVKQNEAQLRTDRGNERAAVAKLAADKAKLTVGGTTYTSADNAVSAYTAIVAQDSAAQQSAQQTNYDLQLQQTRDQQQLSSDQTSLSRAATSDKPYWQSKVDSDQDVVNADAVKLQAQAKTLNTLAYQLSQDQSTLQTFQTLQSTLTQDLSSIQSYEVKVLSDRNAVTSATASRKSAIETALSNRSSTLSKDEQSITSARQQLASARLSLKATQANNASKATVTNSALAQAEASVVQAQANLATATRTLSQTVLHAPASGTVASVGGVVGQSVSASGNSLVSSSSSSTSTSTASASGSSGFVQLVKVGGLQVTATFSESDAAKIHVGQPATVTVSALPSEKLAAHVIAVDTVGTSSSGVVQYSVTLALDGTTSSLKPGMSASVTVTTAERDNVINVPNAAVTGSGANATVKVMQNGTQRTISVVAGLKGDSTTVVASGLKAGQQVVIATVTATSSAGSGANGFPGLGGAAPGGGGLGGGRGFPGGGPSG